MVRTKEGNQKLIYRVLEQYPDGLRFSDLYDKLKGEMAKATLSNTLKELEKEGKITRDVKIGERGIFYKLSDKTALISKIILLDTWNKAKEKVDESKVFREFLQNFMIWVIFSHEDGKIELMQQLLNDLSEFMVKMTGSGFKPSEDTIKQIEEHKTAIEKYYSMKADELRRLLLINIGKALKTL